MLSMSVSAIAESENVSSALLTETVVAAEPDDEGYVLIAEEESIVDGYSVVDRTYVMSSISTQANGEGSDTIKKSRSIYKNESNYGDLIAIMWVQGYFKWSASKDIATISNPKAWIDIYNNNYKIYDEEGYPKYDSNQGATVLWGLFGNKYAYIEYIINVENAFGVPTKFRLYLDVNVNGDPKVRT